MLADFKKFIMRGNVLDLAVAVVIGVAFQAVITAFVDNILNPIIAAIFGEPDLTQVLAIDIGDATMTIGGFLQAVLDFLIIGFALFMVIKAYETMQNRRKTDEIDLDEADEPTDEVVLLTEIRDALRTNR